MSATSKDIGVSTEGAVGIVEITRPPHNFFDNSLINQIADAFEAFDRDNNIRAYVLCAQGKSFCAGADFANRPRSRSRGNYVPHERNDLVFAAAVEPGLMWMQPDAEPHHRPDVR